MKVSPSSLKLFRLCPRRWYETYVLGHREQPTQAMLDGIALHKQLENNLGEGHFDWPKHESLRIQLRKMSESSNLLCEENMETQVSQDLWFTGRIDALAADAHIVYDFKTVNSFKYMMSAEDLLRDPAALMYGLMYSLESGSLGCYLEWIYVHRKTHETRLSGARFVLSKCSKQIQKILADAQTMQKTKSNGIPKRNLDACFAYNRPCYLTQNCWDDTVRDEWINLQLRRNKQ